MKRPKKKVPLVASALITFKQKKIEEILLKHICDMMGDQFRESEVLGMDFVLGRTEVGGEPNEELIVEIKLK